MKKESRGLNSQGNQEENQIGASDADGMDKDSGQEKKKMFAHPMVNILVGSVAFTGLLYASRYMMNYAVVSARACKNFRKEIQEK